MKIENFFSRKNKIALENILQNAEVTKKYVEGILESGIITEKEKERLQKLSDYKKGYAYSLDCLIKPLKVSSNSAFTETEMNIHYGKEFLLWLKAYNNNEQWATLKDIYTDFLQKNKFDPTEYGIKKFSKALDEAAKIKSNFIKRRIERNGLNVVEVCIIKV